MKKDVASTELTRRGVGKLVGTLGFLLVLILFVGLAFPALAGMPVQPHQFYGDVEGAWRGFTVSARIEGVEYETTTVDAGGQYGYEPLFKVPADDLSTSETKEGGVDGDTVEFYVGGVLAECSADGGATWQDDYTFKSGETTELDLRPLGEPPIRLYLPFVANETTP